MTESATKQDAGATPSDQGAPESAQDRSSSPAIAPSERIAVPLNTPISRHISANGRKRFKSVQDFWRHMADAVQCQCECDGRGCTICIGAEAFKEAIAAVEAGSGETAPAWQPLDAIVAEMHKAARKFPTWPTRGTDAAAIVAEECGELQQAVLQATYEGGNVEAVRKEAIQTAAMVIQFILNLPDTRFDAGEQLPKRLPAPPSGGPR